jgi:o-succinylbenzoate synthase
MALLNIKAFDVYRFSIRFIRPIQVDDAVLHDREGLIIALTDHKDRTGYGEIAPLAGLDQTSLEQCHEDVSGLRKTLDNASFPSGQFRLASPGLGLAAVPAGLSSHTLFGLESALLSLHLQDDPAGLPDLISVPVNGLFIPDPVNGQTDAQIQTLLAGGMKTIKVKIGRLPEEQEIRQILRLADAVGMDVMLRLDGNRSLSASTYARYFSALGHLHVEYAEEPLRDMASLPSANVPWQLALDESLPRYLDSSHPDPAKLPSSIRAVILKPGLLSGLSGMASFIADAGRQNIQTVLSSAFNTGVGLAALGVLAHLTGLSSDTACGFDTLRYLKSDVLTQSPTISGGSLLIPQKLLSGMPLNFSVLSRENL